MSRKKCVARMIGKIEGKEEARRKRKKERYTRKQAGE
jgi:hypothetical protein